MTASTTSDFAAPAALARARDRSKIARRKCWRISKLSRHRADMVALRLTGASYADVQQWLRHERRVVAARSTVWRYLARLPELSEVCDAKL